MKARKTRARVAIAIALLSDSDRVQWGYELSRRAGVGAGSMYPFLAELLAAGHLADGWEPASNSGRPPRRYYRLTESGRQFLADFASSAPAPAARGRTRLGSPVVDS